MFVFCRYLIWLDKGPYDSYRINEENFLRKSIIREGWSRAMPLVQKNNRPRGKRGAMYPKLLYLLGAKLAAQLLGTKTNEKRMLLRKKVKTLSTIRV